MDISHFKDKKYKVDPNKINKYINDIVKERREYEMKHVVYVIIHKHNKEAKNTDVLFFMCFSCVFHVCYMNNEYI